MIKWEHIWQVIGAVILFAMLVWMLQGCRTPQPIVQEVTKEVVVEREVRDTIVTIAPDSASIKALLECDSAGNVLIKELQEVQGKNVSLQAQLKNTNKGTALVIDCKQDSLDKVIAIQEEQIKELNSNKQVETIEVKYIPAFYKWSAWVCWGMIAFILIRIAFWVYKKFVLKV